MDKDKIKIHVKKGDKYNRWSVIKEKNAYLDKSSKKIRIIHCKCDCGTERVVVFAHLRNGTSSSCGCYQRELVSSHGMTDTKEWKSWMSMKARCTQKNRHDYKNYGGRGITYCKKWEKFENFYKDMGDAPSPQHSIDRINNDKGYKPSNCRWATWREQQNNRRSNHWVEYKGERKTVMQWSRKTGIPHDTLLFRLMRLKWSTEDALTKEVRDMNLSPTQPSKTDEKVL